MVNDPAFIEPRSLDETNDIKTAPALKIKTVCYMLRGYLGRSPMQRSQRIALSFRGKYTLKYE